MRRALPFAILLFTTNAWGQAQEGPQGPPEEPFTPHPTAAIAQPPQPTGFSFRRAWGWADTGPRLDVAGYLLPQFEIVSQPDALPRENLQYGARGTRAGFALYGMPVPGWSYIANVVLVPAGTESLSVLSPSSEQAVGLTLSSATQTSIDVEEASLAYRPTPWMLAKIGLSRIPFSLGQMTPIPMQMFPLRPPVTGDFQSGADAGALATFAPFDHRIRIDLGFFLGSSLGAAGSANETIRGPALVGSVSAQPLGAMSLREGDEDRGPLKLAFGFSSIYRRATAYDPTGYEASKFADARIAAYVRASIRGFYAQGEFLRRLRTDDVSGRPNVSQGAYGQASYFQPVGSFAVAPVLRFSALQTSHDFDPRTFTSYELGVAFYPHGSSVETERLKILAEYLHAATTPHDEVQHEGLLQLQLEF